jgi:hypothetical protein
MFPVYRFKLLSIYTILYSVCLSYREKYVF